MSHDPVTRDTFISGDLIMFFVAVDDGIPDISARKVDENSISGLTDVMAAVSFRRGHAARFT